MNINSLDILKNYHILPMISSIWSSDIDNVKNFPLVTFINFLKIIHYLNLKIGQNGNMFLEEVMNI